MDTARLICTALAPALLAGCTGSTTFTGRPDGGTDAPADTVPAECSSLWDCNPGVPCGWMVPCIAGECRPDAPPVDVECPPETECRTDGDCIIADPYDCCNGCPVAIPRSGLGEHVCHYERGLPPPGPPPVECMVDCMACPPCYPQPLAVGCRAGSCVAVEEGCPYPWIDEPVYASAAEVAADPFSYSGRTVVVSGSTIARWPACDAFCDEGEPCCDASLFLDGVIRLTGRPCDTPMSCSSDTSCPDEWDCGAFREGGGYEMTGEIRISTVDGPPSMYVEGVRDIAPPGFGGAYEITILSVATSHPDPWGECPEEVPVVGETGRLVVADAGGELVVTTPLFGDWSGCSEFWGARDLEAFEARVPILCDGWCDFTIEGGFSGSSISGTYRYFDGYCTMDVEFEGSRY